ncbi:MAG: four helix bundle protein [Fischerella sp.]|nr:four helix bundle protein [Fischerella sp.]
MIWEYRGFESLDFYQDGLKLLKAAYRLSKSLPDYERYNLSDQLRRASCSVLLNIAEGYGRDRYLDKFIYCSWLIGRD